MKTVQVEYWLKWSNKLYLADITVDLDVVKDLTKEIQKILKRRYVEIDHWHIKKWYDDD